MGEFVHDIDEDTVAIPGHTYRAIGIKNVTIMLPSSHEHYGECILLKASVLHPAAMRVTTQEVSETQEVRETIDGSFKKVMFQGDEALLFAVKDGWCKIKGISHPYRGFPGPDYLL